METITSRSNPLCTHLRKLASDRAYRRRSGEFLCDSPKLLEEALLHGGDLRTVVCTEDAALPPIPAGVRLVTVPADVMKSVSPAQTPQGVLAVCAMRPTALPETLPGKRYVVLDGVQATMGAVFRCPVWNCDIPDLRHLLTASGLPLYGAALRADTVDARTLDYSRCAIAIGSEGKGLSQELLAVCDQTALIPMSDHCESLNAAMAATVLLWEAARND